MEGSNKNNDDKKKESKLIEPESNKEQVKEHIEVEKTGKPVILRAEAYKTIILYASRYANQAILSSDWKEIYGLLIGNYDDDFLYVEKAIPMTYGHDTDVEFSEKDYGNVEKIHEELDKEGKGYFIIGWFHSHPGLTLFFTEKSMVKN